jgi:SAM-dependent methyltransferase
MSTTFTLAVDYSQSAFLETSRVAAKMNRLNWRAEVLLARNREAVEGKTVLDLACHDARFSYACLKLGAQRVQGVEGRDHLVENARKNLAELGYGTDKCGFACGDLFDYLASVEPGQFDTILCFGVFYHTIRQIELLQQIKRIRPRYFILDTFVEKEQSARIATDRIDTTLGRLGKATTDLVRGKSRNVGCLVFMYENPEIEGATIDPTGLIAWPTASLVDVLFQYYGFKSQRIDWHQQGIDDWSHIKDYRMGTRLSWIAQPGYGTAGDTSASASTKW